MNALPNNSLRSVLTLLFTAASLFIFLFAISCFSQPAFAQDSHLAVGMPSKQDATNRDSQNKYTTVASIDLNRTTAVIKNDKALKLKATLIPADAMLPLEDSSITWKVSNPKIARISEDGTVQGKKTGTVTVTATAKNGVKATAKIKVVIDRFQMATNIPVITYHRNTSDSAKRKHYRNNELAESKSQFQKEMQWLKRNGYHTISTSEFADWRLEGAFLPKKSVLITIDDGFYETYYFAYPILRKYNLKAAVFIIGNKTKKRTAKFNSHSQRNHYMGRDTIRKVTEAYPNLEFQSHTYNMHRKINGKGVVTYLSRKCIDADFRKNKRYGFTAFAYPFGHTSANIIASLSHNPDMRIAFGYRISCPATRTSPRYNIPRFKVGGNTSFEEFQRIVRTAR